MSRETEKTLLGGRIFLQNLSQEADSRGRFRGGDERGEVSVLMSGLPVEHVEYAEFSGGGIKRGFHYHKACTEYVYVLHGRLIFLWKHQ